MRRFAASSPSFGCVSTVTARRTMLTGFSLFTREVQRKEKILKTKSLAEGSRKNLKTVAALWRQLDVKTRRQWNEKAKVARTHRTNDVYKRNSAFNLVMKVFAQGDGALLKAGDEKFTAMIAKRTAEALSPKQTGVVLKHFDVNPEDTLFQGSERGGAKAKAEAAHHRAVFPDMRLFHSFTEMQHAVAPTRETAFLLLHQLQRREYLTGAGAKSLKQKFKQFTLEQQNQFSPISEEEAPAFETFCATKCTLHNPHRFDILSLFAEFRGLAKVTRSPNSTQIALYRSFAAADRVRDGLYHKSHRILLRLRACRSSECGQYISSVTSGKASVPGEAYSVNGGTLTDVDVARMLAETRSNDSVYDDVLTRANVLRSAQHQKMLQPYKVRENVLHEKPVALVQIKRASSEVAVLGRAAQATKKTLVVATKAAPRSEKRLAVTATKPKTHKKPVAAREVPRRTASLARGKTKPAAAAQRASRRSSLAAASVRAVVKKVKKVQKPSAGKRKTVTKLSASARKRSTARVVASTTKNRSPSAAKQTKAMRSASPTAGKRNRTKVVRAGKETPTTLNAVGEGSRTDAAIESAAVGHALSVAEENMLTGQDDLADYDAFDEAPVAEAAARPSAAPTKAATAAKSAPLARRRGRTAKRRIHNVAGILRGIKKPVVVTSHMTPPKAKGKKASPPGGVAVGSTKATSTPTTVDLLRKQLAGIL